MNKQLVLILICFALLGLCTAGGLAFVSWSAPNEDIEQFPVYSGATHAHYVNDIPEKGAEYSQYLAGIGYLDNTGVLQFATSEQPDAVFDYYNAWLIANAWSPQGMGIPANWKEYLKEYDTFGGLRFVSSIQVGEFTIPWLRATTLHTRYQLELSASSERDCFTGGVVYDANRICLRLDKYVDYR